MNFIAIDVETANSDYSSICQVGIVEFRDGKIYERWSTLVNPEAYFDPFNSGLHGILESDVLNAPTFDKIYGELENRIKDKITVHHMPFDKIAINRACSEYGLSFIDVKWLDSSKIVRRTWKEFSNKGYGLANVAAHLQINFTHHDAVEDAHTAAQVVVAACRKMGLTVEEWFDQIGLSIHKYHKFRLGKSLEEQGDGPLTGENIVFTGELSLPRHELAEIAAGLGSKVSSSVSKRTTILVVGIQSAFKLAGYNKSSKHRKAEDLIHTGVPIRILSEKDFAEMCNTHDVMLSVNSPLGSTDIVKPKLPAEKIEKREARVEIPIDPELLELWDKSRAHFMDITHDVKRTIGNLILSSIKAIVGLPSTVSLDKKEDAIILGLILEVENEVDEFKETVYQLMRNKCDLEELNNQLEWFRGGLEVYYEDNKPNKSTEHLYNTYYDQLSKELLKIEELLNQYLRPK